MFYELSRTVPAEVPTVLRAEVAGWLADEIDRYEAGTHPYFQPGRHIPRHELRTQAQEMASFLFHRRYNEQHLRRLHLTPDLLAGWGQATTRDYLPDYWHFFRVSHHPVCGIQLLKVGRLQHATPGLGACPGCAALLLPELLADGSEAARLAAQVLGGAVARRAGGSAGAYVQQGELFSQLVPTHA